MRVPQIVSVLAALTLAPAALLDAQVAKQSTPPPAVRATARAIRMDLRPKTSSVYVVGQKPDLVLRLLDPNGRPYVARKAFSIEVEVFSSSGQRVHRESITLERGASLENFDLDVNDLKLTGVLRVKTTHPELLEGGTVLYVVPPSRNPPVRRGTSRVETDAPVLAYRQEIPRDVVVYARRQSTGCGGMLLISPARTFWADGKDAAELTLLVDPARRRTAFYIQTTLGQVTPNPILIEVDQPIGTARISSSTVGDATITCVRAVPSVQQDEAPTATVRFRQPITGFELAVTPPRIPSIDRATITVTLQRVDGVPIESDERRTVALRRDKGGEIVPEDIEIKAGDFKGTAIFQPYDRGVVRISATTPGFQTQFVELEVALPFLLFLLPPLGGMCGGLVAAVRDGTRSRERAAGGGGAGAVSNAATTRQATGANATTSPATRPSLFRIDGPLVRVLVGIVTGALLQWALVFDVLPVLPRPAVMSLVSWFFIPVVGGWLGTEVFRIAATQLGVGAKAGK
jgi:hypothetical protein